MPTSARGLYLIVPHPKVECVQNKLSLKQSRCLWFPRSTQTIHHQLTRALLEYFKSGCGDDSSASGVTADTSLRFSRRQTIAIKHPPQGRLLRRRLQRTTQERTSSSIVCGSRRRARLAGYGQALQGGQSRRVARNARPMTGSASPPFGTMALEAAMGVAHVAFHPTRLVDHGPAASSKKACTALNNSSRFFSMMMLCVPSASAT